MWKGNEKNVYEKDMNKTSRIEEFSKRHERKLMKK